MVGTRAAFNVDSNYTSLAYGARLLATCREVGTHAGPNSYAGLATDISPAVCDSLSAVLKKVLHPAQAANEELEIRK